MKKDTVDEIVGRALRGAPYVPTGDEDVPVSAQPAAPQGVAYAELPKDVIRAVFIENGFTIKEGQSDLKQYVYDAAQALLRAASAKADSVLEDAARWNEVLMHVGAANHLGGQHFTLNTLRIRDQMFLLRGSVAQHFTACIDDSRAARKQGGTQ